MRRFGSSGCAQRCAHSRTPAADPVPFPTRERSGTAVYCGHSRGGSSALGEAYSTAMQGVRKCRLGRPTAMGAAFRLKHLPAAEKGGLASKLQNPGRAFVPDSKCAKTSGATEAAPRKRIVFGAPSDLFFRAGVVQATARAARQSDRRLCAGCPSLPSRIT